jgi:hypothetical protein
MSATFGGLVLDNLPLVDNLFLFLRLYISQMDHKNFQNQSFPWENENFLSADKIDLLIVLCVIKAIVHFLGQIDVKSPIINPNDTEVSGNKKHCRKDRAICQPRRFLRAIQPRCGNSSTFMGNIMNSGRNHANSRRLRRSCDVIDKLDCKVYLQSRHLR